MIIRNNKKETARKNKKRHGRNNFSAVIIDRSNRTTWMHRHTNERIRIARKPKDRTCYSSLFVDTTTTSFDCCMELSTKEKRRKDRDRWITHSIRKATANDNPHRRWRGSRHEEGNPKNENQRRTVSQKTKTKKKLASLGRDYLPAFLPSLRAQKQMNPSTGTENQHRNGPVELYYTSWTQNPSRRYLHFKKERRWALLARKRGSKRSPTGPWMRRTELTKQASDSWYIMITTTMVPYATESSAELLENSPWAVHVPWVPYWAPQTLVDAVLSRTTASSFCDIKQYYLVVALELPIKPCRQWRQAARRRRGYISVHGFWVRDNVSSVSHGPRATMNKGGRRTRQKDCSS